MKSCKYGDNGAIWKNVKWKRHKISIVSMIMICGVCLHMDKKWSETEKIKTVVFEWRKLRVIWLKTHKSLY